MDIVSLRAPQQHNYNLGAAGQRRINKSLHSLLICFKSPLYCGISLRHSICGIFKTFIFHTSLKYDVYIGFADHHGWCEEIPTFSILSFCEGWVKVITKYVPAQEATGSNVTICLHDTAVLLLVPSRTCPPSLQSQRRSAFSWLNADTIAFTFNNLSRHPYDLCIGDPIFSWVNACLE